MCVNNRREYRGKTGPAEERGAGGDRRLVASGELPLGRADLSARQPAAAPAARPEDVKPRLLGHWGTTPGLNFVYAHMNREIVARNLSAIYVTGPGHGGPGLVASAYLDGTYTEVYPHIGRDEEGLRRLFRQFSFPGGIPSHVAPETPGSIHEGGELGYSLLHAYGAVFDNPDLLAVCVIGDGEAETGALAASWHSNKFLNPARDGAVLPILHLNGYKIANPTVLARIDREELRSLLEGFGHDPRFVEGSEPGEMHELMAATLDAALDDIAAIQARARSEGDVTRPRWPMIVLCTPKGWTGPERPSTDCRPRDRFVPTRSRWPRCGRIQIISTPSRSGCARTVRRSCSMGRRAAGRHRRSSAVRSAADEREPQRRRRPAAARARAARFPWLCRRRAERREAPARPRVCSEAGSVT